MTNASEYYVCDICGYRSPRPLDRKKWPVHHNCQSRGFGDTIARVTKAVGIKPCGGCKKRQVWFNKVFPYRNEAAETNGQRDVLIFTSGNTSQLSGSKAWYQAHLLGEHGIGGLVIVDQWREPQQIVDAIGRHSPKLIVNRAMLISPERIEILADKYPHISFLTVNHSSQADLARKTHWVLKQAKFIDLAKRKDNCWFGLVDERNPIFSVLRHPRCVWFPNPVHRVTCDPKPLPDVPNVSLICAGRQLKNIPNQIVGAAKANKTRPIRLVYSSRNKGWEAHTALAEVLGLPFVNLEWQQWKDYLYYTCHKIDLGLQVSYTESFNYVALEHMMMGKPVVGCDAVRYIPSTWRARADDPDDIARVILELLDDCATARTVGLQVAESVVVRNNASFIHVVNRMLDS